MNDIIEKYKRDISYFEELINTTNKDSVRNLATGLYIDFAKELSILENKDISFYLDRLKSFKEDLKEEKNEDNSTNTLVQETFLKLVRKLEEDFKIPNMLSIKTWVDNFNVFLEQYKDVLDKDKLVSYVKEIFNKYDKDGKYIDLLNENKEKHNSNEELKIITVKRKRNFKSIKNNINLRAFKTLFERFGYVFNEDELLDKEGKKVSKSRLEKDKTYFLKQELIKLSSSNNEGLISKSYKKNRITSMLLNMKLVKSINSLFSIKEEVENKNIDMYKGMGKC